MLFNTEAELMQEGLEGGGLAGLGGLGCGGDCGCGCEKGSSSLLSLVGMGGLGSMGDTAPTNCGWWSLPGSKCWNYSHYPIPPVVAPIAPPITSSGRTTATIDEIIAGTFDKQQGVWSEVLGGAAPPEEEDGEGTNWWLIGGVVVVGVIVLAKKL